MSHKYSPLERMLAYMLHLFPIEPWFNNMGPTGEDVMKSVKELNDCYKKDLKAYQKNNGLESDEDKIKDNLPDDIMGKARKKYGTKDII